MCSVPVSGRPVGVLSMGQQCLVCQHRLVGVVLQLGCWKPPALAVSVLFGCQQLFWV